MAESSVTEIAARLGTFLTRPNPVLFAGAGVGARVDYPTWKAYILLLADTCEQYRDQESAALIRKRVNDGHYLGAASVYKTSNLIPKGERWKMLAKPFAHLPKPHVLSRLDGLVTLPFGAIVTTNYDQSLHHVYSSVFSKWVPSVERGKLRSASHSREYYIAQIHGSAAYPASMAIDVNDYEELSRESDYLDFLLNLLQTRSCFFFGFSFLDPAINHVLGVYADRHGPVFDRLHLALVPVGSSELITRLHAVNIETLEYRPTNEHADAWRAIRQAADSHVASDSASRSVVDPTFGYGSLHRFFAFVHTQAAMRSVAHPIVEIAQDGLVASCISASLEAVDEDVVGAEVASLLRLSRAEAQNVVVASTGRLVARGNVTRHNSTLRWVGSRQSSVDRDLDQLTKDVTHRMQVEHGVPATGRDQRATKALLENVLMTRAWDLGAQLAGGNSSWTTDTGRIIANALTSLRRSEQPTNAAPLSRALRGLLRNPDDQEAELLTRLGRAAFGVQLVLASPRHTLFHQHALPRVVYLDSNVLMPTITVGHPFEPVYRGVVARLSKAAQQAGTRVTIAVGQQFLNEIVTHRKGAIDMVRAGGLENADDLRRHILFHSAVNTNVFVGAYAATMGLNGTLPTFDEFLRDAAPYESEQQLATHLKRKGIHSVAMEFRDEHNRDFVSVLNPLKDAYYEVEREKATVLIDHEAQQMTQLSVDARSGVTSVFVTADRRLRRAVALADELRPMLGLLVSQQGLVALVDVMVGLESDAGSLARMMWLSTDTDEKRELVEYFVNLGLRRYDEHLASELQVLAEQCADDAEQEARAEKLDLSKTGDEIERVARFLDRCENRFYERWDEAIRRRYKSD